MDILNTSEYLLYNNFNRFFVLLGLILTLSTGLAAYVYLKKNKSWYYLLNIFYILGFFLVITTKSWFLFIIGWEIVTVATTFMIIWSDKRVAKQYFFVQFIGSSILLYVILLAVSMGYNSVEAVNEIWLQNLFIIGLGMKSGIFGLHFWLPPVHSKAPAPVSAILSGWVVKLGFITTIKLMPGSNNFLLILGFLMIFYGGIKAVFQTNLKVLLAYSTISQLGFIALGIGSGTFYGTVGAVFHITAHSLAKTGLFINSGFLKKEYHSLSIYDVDNFWKRNKVPAAAIIISLLSLMGTFFLTGYHSKHFIKYSIKGSFYLKLLLHGTGLVTALYSLRLIWWLWLKDLFRKSAKKAEKIKVDFSPGIFGYTADLVLVLLLLFTGIFPDYIAKIIFAKKVTFHFLDGLVSYLVYLILGIIILKKFGWVKSKEKEPPSLDMMFENINRYLYNFSSRSLDFDTGVFFESHFYYSIFRGARWLYNKIYTDFQLQLLWIPGLLFLLYGWISFVY